MFTYSIMINVYEVNWFMVLNSDDQFKKEWELKKNLQKSALIYGMHFFLENLQ